MTRGKRKRLCLGEQDESKSEIIVPQNSVNTFVSSAIFGTGESFWLAQREWRERQSWRFIA